MMKREDKDLKIFTLVLAIVLAFISLKLTFLERQEFGRGCLFSALLLFAIGILRPKILMPFYRVWMVLVKAISWLVAATFLILVFYLVITPIGLFLRLSGKDLLGLKMNECDSYWFKKEESVSKESYLKQY